MNSRTATNTLGYQYSGNMVTSTDPAGKIKAFVSDAFGNLTSVTEDPNPAMAVLMDVYNNRPDLQAAFGGNLPALMAWAATSAAETEDPVLTPYQSYYASGGTQQMSGLNYVTNYTYDYLNLRNFAVSDHRFHAKAITDFI